MLWMISFWRQRHLFFVSEKWCGYIYSNKLNDFIGHPFISRCILLIWLAAAICFTFNIVPVLALMVNLVLCRYYFIHLRWLSLSRGCGAPGFCSYWLGMAVFILEVTSLPDTLPALRNISVFVLRLEFAIIFLSAGFYKFFSGYRHGQGMEYGMVNPMWGYWSEIMAGMSPKNPIYKICNHLAWSTEIVAGILMLVPHTQSLGGLLLALSFIFIGIQIRLGFLCHMVILISLLYFSPDIAVFQQLPNFNGLSTEGSAVFTLPLTVQAVLIVFISVYGVLLPFMYGGLWMNHKFKLRLPGSLQTCLDKYTNFFGMVIWRVFSADLTNFKVNVIVESEAGEKEVTNFNKSLEIFGSRYSQVIESITCACLFSTLKYYPDNKQLFIEKIFRYAKTVSNSKSWVKFRIELITKGTTCFLRHPAAEYRIHTGSKEYSEQIFDKKWLAPDGKGMLSAAFSPGTYLK